MTEIKCVSTHTIFLTFVLVLISRSAYPEDKSFIHVPLWESVGIQRLSRTVEDSVFGGQIYGRPIQFTMTTRAINLINPTYGGSLFITDGSWRRILFGRLYASPPTLYKYPPPESLWLPGAIESSNGDSLQFWTNAAVYLSEYGKLSRFLYDHSHDTLVLETMFSVSTDSLRVVSDLALHDGGELNNVQNDYLWAVDRSKNRLLKYQPHASPGIVYQYPHEDQTNPFRDLVAVSCGRFNGPNNDLVYAVDMGAECVIRFLDIGDSLEWETQYQFTETEAVTPNAIEVDAYGAVYVTDFAGSRIYKFSRDLELLKVFDPDEQATDGLYRPLSIVNPRGAYRAVSFGELFVTERLGEFSGGQHFVIGTEITESGLSVSESGLLLLPYYICTDAHYLTALISVETSPDNWLHLAVLGSLARLYGRTDLPPFPIPPQYRDTSQFRFRTIIEAASFYKDPASGASFSSDTAVNYAYTLCSCTHQGDVAPLAPQGDGISNVLDVVAMIDYVFRQGPVLPTDYPICPKDRADVAPLETAGDGQINVLDVVAYIDRVFRSGPNYPNPCAYK